MVADNMTDKIIEVLDTEGAVLINDAISDHELKMINDELFSLSEEVFCNLS